MDKLIETVARTARDLWLRGWAERNAGNLSVLLTPDQTPRPASVDGVWRPIQAHLPDVAGRRFLFTSTGSFMRVVARDPGRDLGVIEIDDAGLSYRTLWGFRESGCPTSELRPHLRAHAARMRSGDIGHRAVIHTHPANVIALTYVMPLTTASLTRLLWEMHTECIVVFPKGCGFVEWRMPGSEDLARATEAVMEKRTMAVWQHHGIVATGPDLDTAFGLIETAEKAAEIYLKAAALGPVALRLSAEQLTGLARNFGVEPDPEILGEGT